MMKTIIPHTGNVQRYGYDNALHRVTLVHLNANRSCKGNKPLHEVHALRFDNGAKVYWFATDEQARKAGWL